MPEDDDERQRRDRRYVEFGRVLGLSDSVFGIALTLLVVTLDASAVRLTGLAVHVEESAAGGGHCSPGLTRSS